MKINKVIICTLLFAVVLISIIVGAMFVKGEYINLYKLFANCVVVSWTYNRIKDFYYWLQED